MFPVTPTEFKTVLAAPASSLCAKFVRILLNMPTLLYRIIVWAVNEDGSISDNAKSWIGLATGGGIPAPTNLVAVGAASQITLTWAAVNLATSYNVYRSDTPVPPSILTPTFSGIALTTFVDSAAQGTFAANKLYYYWVAALNSSATSVFSNPASASAGSIGSPAEFGSSAGSVQQFTVPAGVAALNIEGWGGGGAGGGGGKRNSNGPAVITNFPGAGGGGSGEYRKGDGLVVTPLEVLNVMVAPGGFANGPGNAGSAAGASYVYRTDPSAPIFRAYGGLGGQAPGAGNSVGGNGGSGGTGVTDNEPGKVGSDGTSTSGGAGGIPVDGSGASPTSPGGGGQGAPPFVDNPQVPYSQSANGSNGSEGKIIFTW